MIRECGRILTFAYGASLPVIFTMWSINVLPEIMTNNFGFEPEFVAGAVSWFFSTYYYGIIIGCFIWPIIGKKLYKRTSLMIALVVTCLCSFLMGQSTSFVTLCLCRFLAGLMHNMNSVGKDFIYEFAHTPMTRQYGFSAKSAFNVISLFAGPYAGFLLYTYSGKDFATCCNIVSILYLVGIFFFIIFFFLDYNVEKEIEMDTQHEGHVDPEEAKTLVENGKKEELHDSMLTITKNYLSNSYLRGLIVTYVLNNAINKTVVIFMVMLTTMPWAMGGLGMTTKTFSLISLFSFAPSLVILFSAPLFVPKKMHYYTFIKTMILMTIFALIAIPSFRDIFTPETVNNWFVYIVISLIFWMNPKQFSPFINVLINNETSKANRTTVNALLFLSEIAGAAICINLMAPVYRYSIYNSYFISLAPYNKYIPFAVLSLGLLASVMMLRISDYNAVKKKHELEHVPQDTKA